MKAKKHLQVNAIKDGIVIDHLPAKYLFKVISILNLDKVENTITFGTNLESQKLGKKAIIKIEGVSFHQEEINKIALVAPNAKLNFIKNYEVIEKKQVEVPDTITGIVRCVNPQCITNNQAVKTKFTVISKKEVKLRCHYCEKITDQDQITLV